MDDSSRLCGVVKGRALLGELSGALASGQMEPAAVFDGERLAALRDTALIDGEPDDAFARLTGFGSSYSAYRCRSYRLSTRIASSLRVRSGSPSRGVFSRDTAIALLCQQSSQW